MAEKLNKISTEMEILKSYTDSLDHLTKLEKKLNTLRRESSSKVHSLNIKNLNFRSVYVKPHLKDLSYHKLKGDLIRLKHDGYVSTNKTSKACNSLVKISNKDENDKLFSSESEAKHRIGNHLNNNYDALFNNEVSNISNSDKTIIWNSENDVHHSTNLVDHLNNVCHKLIYQNTQDEKLLSTYLNIVLSIREKAVISSTKQKLSRLKVKGNNAVDQLSSLRKKQRGLLIKLQHEYNEIKFMKSFQKRLFEERKKVLLQQLRHFKTISGIDSRCKVSPNSFNFKNYTNVSKEKNKKSPVKCYDVAFNFKKKSDLFEKRIMLRSHKKTLNDLLSLYFDLQLNAIGLYTINQNNSSSQIIGMLKEISQKSVMNDYKPDQIDISPFRKNLESNISKSCIENSKIDENVLGTSSLRNDFAYKFTDKQNHCKSKASILTSYNMPNFTNDKSKLIEIESCNGEKIITSEEIDEGESSEPVITELPPQNDSDSNFTHLKNDSVIDLKRENFNDRILHKNKDILSAFSKGSFFSNWIKNSVDNNLQGYSVNCYEDVHLVNLINFKKFSMPFITFGSIENKFSKIAKYQRHILNENIVNLFRKFHTFTKMFLQGRKYEFSHEIQAIVNSENDNTLFKELFKETKNYILKDSKSIIQVLNFSLSDFSEVVKIMTHMCSNINLQNNIDPEFNYFRINIKENLMLDGIDLTCSIMENVDKIEFSETHNYQTYEIYDVYMDNYDFGIFKTSNIDSLNEVHTERHKFPQPNDVLQKSVSAISDNVAISSKSKQSDVSSKDDSYQKILEMQSGRKMSFGKQFKDLPEIPINSKSKTQDLFAEKETSTHNLEPNIHNKLLPYTAMSKSLNQLEEAEELRKKQLAVEMEIKALLEQQTSQFSYFLVREIPDKPPPPYIPPETKVDFTNVQLPKSETAVRTEQVNEIIKICYENIWQPFLVNAYSIDCDTDQILNDQYALFKKTNSISNCFVFDLCNELFSLKYKNVTKTTHLWEYKRRIKYSKADVCKSIETLAMQCLGYGNNLWKDNIFINCAHKIQDHVDELLIKELQDEEAEWVNIEEYEMSIKNVVAESILNMLLTDTIQEYTELIVSEN